MFAHQMQHEVRILLLLRSLLGPMSPTTHVHDPMQKASLSPRPSSFPSSSPPCHATLVEALELLKVAPKVAAAQASQAGEVQRAAAMTTAATAKMLKVGVHVSDSVRQPQSTASRRSAPRAKRTQAATQTAWW